MKIYCKSCKYGNRYLNSCNGKMLCANENNNIIIDNFYSKRVQYGCCEQINKNNDCEFYKEKRIDYFIIDGLVRDVIKWYKGEYK